MKKKAILMTCIAASILLAACSPKSTQPTATPEVAQSQSLIAEGRVLPLETLDQSFTIPGQIAEILVKDGESVKVGQALVRLQDSPDAEVALARAKQEALAAKQALDLFKSSADLNLAQAQLAYLNAKDQAEKAQTSFDANDSDVNKASLDVAAANLQAAEDILAKLKSSNGLDPDQLAGARARLDSANAAVISAQAMVDAQVLKAAMQGTVVDLSLQVGQQVANGEPVLAIADFSNWLVKTDNLTEMEITGVKVGQKVEVVLDALPGKTLAGEVTHINARFEEKRGDITYTATIRLNQTDIQMRWGMTAAVHFSQ